MFDFKDSNLMEFLKILCESKNIHQVHMSDKGVSILFNGNDSVKNKFIPMTHVESIQRINEPQNDELLELEKAKQAIYQEQDRLEDLSVSDPYEYEQLLANHGAKDNGPI